VIFLDISELFFSALMLLVRYVLNDHDYMASFHSIFRRRLTRFNTRR